MKSLIFIFAYLIENVFSVLPNWKLKESSIDLLGSGDTHEYTIYEKNMYTQYAKLTKKITRSSTGITHENTLTLSSSSTVTFEGIESQYSFSQIKVLCPRGSFNPINLNDYDNTFDYGSEWVQSQKWDLKCYYHREGYLLVYYLMNGNHEVQACKVDGTTWTQPENLQISDEIYDYKLVNQGTLGGEYNSDGPYPFMALIKENNVIKLFGGKINFTDSITIENNSTKELITSKKVTQGYFNSVYGNNNFYYITYNNISDFSSGFSLSSISENNYDQITSNTVTFQNNENNPFEYLDEVEIIDIDFLPYNKYIYYSLKNKVTGTTYHGIFDITLNKIMFNTEDKINVFIPYSKNSMLAITDESAYKICAIQSGADCIEECPSGQKIILNTENGNKCVSYS